jgi:hypothetical protein
VRLPICYCLGAKGYAGKLGCGGTVVDGEDNTRCRHRNRSRGKASPCWALSSANSAVARKGAAMLVGVDMLMVCHHLDPRIPEDVAFAESRIRRETIAAEDILHDLGAFSMMSSDSQAMGRVGEVIIRTWQTADKMKRQRGPVPLDSERNDNFRAKRYIAKCLPRSRRRQRYSPHRRQPAWRRLPCDRRVGARKRPAGRGLSRRAPSRLV